MKRTFTACLKMIILLQFGSNAFAQSGSGNNNALEKQA